MTTSNKSGGGFFIGVIYGVIASIALYLVLSFMFPVSIDKMSAPAPVVAQSGAPEVAETASASSPAPDIGSQPTAPATSAPEMAQPDSGSNDAVTLGGGNESGPASMTNSSQIAGGATEREPAVKTESAAVPDIGNGTTETAAPGLASNTPTAPAEVVDTPPGAAAPTALATTASGPAIEVFATAFTGESNKPMLAIVLEDTLETSLQPLVDTGKPFSFAVPAGTDASATARSIREAGFEVVAMIPDGTSRTEGVAANITRFLQNVPVAVALMDANSSMLMLDRSSMQTILNIAGPPGLGLIAFAKNGELIARAQAEEAGVPYGSSLQIPDTFRDEELIIQALNQVALMAGTSDRAIVFAKTRPETISALLRWLDSPRAAQLEIVPVSMVLQRPAN